MPAAPGPRLSAAFVAVLLLSAATAQAQVKWATRLGGCEPPNVFYSARHRAGTQPCCATVPGACPGGLDCPLTGRCQENAVACDPVLPPVRPNVILLLSDDQGACHYGTAPECRNAIRGTPIPPPVTPNLDLLSGHGTVFTIAHNTAAWCFPSINSILTGRYQRNFNGNSRFADAFPTLAKTMRSLGGASGAANDPYHAGSVIGGYCTMLGGKFSASVGDHGFDAVAKSRKLGRTSCAAGRPGSPPRCGSAAQSTYDPATVFNQRDLFEFLEAMLYRVPGTAPAKFRVNPFFVWYAPRIPHAPLTAPLPVKTYLFGPATTQPGLGGVMDLARFCGPGGCASTVSAFAEGKGGSNADFYASVWWMDDAIRDIRRWLDRAGTPHCIGASGRGLYGVTSPADCPGLWATEVTPDPARNTVLIYLSDNGWFLPDSKHSFTENGYRTRIVVFDPRQLPEVPPWEPTPAATPPPRETEALAHGIDVLPTILGLALDTPGAQPCPTGSDGKPCDGRDLRPHLFGPAGEAPAAPADTLRRSLCGHQTNRGDAPTTDRYLLTRPGTVGRCTDVDAPVCAADTDCGANAICLGGHCIGTAEPPCTASAQCGPGGACLNDRCVMGPACIDDAGCAGTLPGRSIACVEPETRWCRNAPGVRCGTHADCPLCPAVPGGVPAPCARVCEARQLKLYVATATVPGALPRPDVTDLFLDPDEVGRLRGVSGTLTWAMSRPNGPYADTMAKLSCCLDDWWPQVAQQWRTICAGGCPDQLTCNQ